MTKKPIILPVACCIAMLLTLFLPLVSVKSYRWNILELPHKIDRLVENAAYNTIGKVLLAALVLLPLLVALMAWLKNRVPKAVALLPMLVAVALIVLLFMAGPVKPGYGLWLYAAVAALVFTSTFKK